MNKSNDKQNIEHFFISRSEYQRGYTAAQLTLSLGQVAMDFSHIERVPRYADGERENDAEHSYMLALVAPEIAEALGLELDSGKITRYAVVHDLVELKTGDVATFQVSEQQLNDKIAKEHAALNELLEELPRSTAKTLAAYESQSDPEARFVRYIDKLLPIVVDIIGSGARVMQEDYSVNSLDQLQQKTTILQERFETMFKGEFPDIDRAHKLLCELLEFKLYDQVKLPASQH